MDEIHHNPKGAGRKPKDFYGLVKAFLGVSYMGLKNSPDVVHHDWEVTDQGCGVVVKSNHKKYWAHKASFVGFPKSHVPIDAAAINYAATNDGQTLIPHLKRLKQHVPLVINKADRVIADGPFNTKANRDFVRDEI